jgi:solute carrier family 25 phosphate transporter 23/24/25/41
LYFFWSCLLCREVLGLAKGYVEEAEEADGGGRHKKKQQQYQVKWKSVKNKSTNKNASVKRLLSGAFAGAVSRTAVAPIEAIRTHLMVGTGAASISSMVQDILRTDGWQGFFRGNGVNVIRVAPSKAIEVHTYV